LASEHSALLAWLRLSLVPGLSGAVWRRLVSAFGTPAAVLVQSKPVLSQLVDPGLAAAILEPSNPAAVESALAWASKPGHAILTVADPRYSALLRETPDPPPLIYAAGRIELLERPVIAIVGSRNATAQGMRNAEAFARALSSAGLCVASGMALGIDAAAHRAALEAVGSTIAVLGNGIDVVYPRRNAALLQQVFSAGLVLSEFPLGTPPLAANFPRRNRIISGVARGCLVIEAALASGSLITARSAVDMGRDVFAIPGSIHSPLSRGCHYLIKQGAKLVETASDVLEEFGMQAGAHAPQVELQDGVSAEERFVLAAMGHDPCDVDTLVHRTRMSVEELLSVLTQLEIDARVSRNHDGSYQRLR